MCSRYNLTSPAEAVRAAFELASIDPFPPRYNIAPTQPVGIVRMGRGGLPEFALVRWGLIPSWVKMPEGRSTLINARSETAGEKPSFRGALRHRRCLVPANGFYEWRGRAGTKAPHLIQYRNRGLMAFAGLWEHWVGADGSEIETMAILTVPASEFMAPIHDRMPAIVRPEDYGTWLDCRSGSAVGILTLLTSGDQDLIEIVDVGSAVNDVRNEGPELVQPVRSRLL